MRYRIRRVLYRIIACFVWLFSPKYKVEGAGNVPAEPSVLVGNHCHMYGPVFAEFYSPVKRKTWCAGEMMERKSVAAYAFQDFWSNKPRWTHPFFRLLSHIIAPLAELIFNNARTIAVYHDTRVLSTFRDSVKTFEAGESIVVFPECYNRHNNIVYDLKRGFVDVAMMYYRKTGKAVPFVPFYVAPKLKKGIYGTPIYFDPQNDLKQERVRICKYLMDEITRLAADLPCHKVVPYPNVSDRQYPMSLPIEVYPDEKTQI